MSYLLSENAARKFGEIVRERDTSVRSEPLRKRKAVYFTTTIMPAYNGESIIPRSTDTEDPEVGYRVEYGTGTVSLLRDVENELTSQGAGSVSVCNPLGEDVPEETLVWLAWWGGKFWVVGFECQPDG